VVSGLAAGPRADGLVPAFTFEIPIQGAVDILNEDDPIAGEADTAPSPPFQLVAAYVLDGRTCFGQGTHSYALTPRRDSIAIVREIDMSKAFSDAFDETEDDSPFLTTSGYKRRMHRKRRFAKSDCSLTLRRARKSSHPSIEARSQMAARIRLAAGTMEN
jgi:hypothetical protein